MCGVDNLVIRPCLHSYKHVVNSKVHGRMWDLMTKSHWRWYTIIDGGRTCRPLTVRLKAASNMVRGGRLETHCVNNLPPTNGIQLQCT